MGREQPCPECAVRKALETKRVVVSEEILEKEGNRPIQVTTIPFRAQNGEWMVAELNVDMTERRKIDDDLRR